jgi:hypothetical protein
MSYRISRMSLRMIASTEEEAQLHLVPYGRCNIPVDNLCDKTKQILGLG